MPHLPKSSHQPLSHINETLTTSAGDEQLRQEHDLNSRRPPILLSHVHFSSHPPPFLPRPNPKLNYKFQWWQQGGKRGTRLQVCQKIQLYFGEYINNFVKVQLQFSWYYYGVVCAVLACCKCFSHFSLIVLQLWTICVYAFDAFIYACQFEMYFSDSWDHYHVTVWYYNIAWFFVHRKIVVHSNLYS
jgi:hypothetical protein